MRVMIIITIMIMTLRMMMVLDILLAASLNRVDQSHQPTPRTNFLLFLQDMEVDDDNDDDGVEVDDYDDDDDTTSKKQFPFLTKCRQTETCCCFFVRKHKLIQF